MSANRPTRSRISSPFVPAPSIDSSEPATDAPADKPKTFMQRWVEPAPALPRPSYAEAGHERHGVVLNMMPLGVGPSAKVLKALANVEKPKKSISSVSTPEVATPEPGPAEEIAEIAEEVAETIETPRQESIPKQTIEEEDEVMPKTPKSPSSARKSVSRPSVGPQSAGQSVFALQQSPMDALMSERPQSRYLRYPSDSATPEPALGPDGLPIINMDFTDRVVEYAVNEALDRHKWPTAYALRTVYDDGRTDPRMVRIFDAVYNGWSTLDQMDEFQDKIRRKKREGKRDRTAEYYFNGEDPAPPRSQGLFSPMSSIQGPVSTYQSVYQTPYTSLPPSQPSTVGDSSQPRASSLVSAAMAVSTSPQPDHEHISKKQRSNSFQPANSLVLNGNASLNGTTKSQSPAVLASSSVGQSPAPGPSPAADTNGDSKVSKGEGKDAQRSRSNSTSSSLSSVNEDLIEDGSILSPARPLPGGAKAPAAAPMPVPGPISSVPSHLAAKYGPVLGLGFGQVQQTPRFVSPYASAEGFQAVALSAEAARHARPISQPAKAGPRTFTFSTVPASASASASAPVARPSSASNNPLPSSTPAASSAPNTTSEPPTKSSMAPTALVHSYSNSSTTSNKKFPATFRIKNSAKAQQAQIQVTQEEVDASNRLKRKARDLTGKAPNTESNERHEVKTAKAATDIAEERGNQSDGADSIAVKPTKKQKKLPKVRLLNRSRETRQNSRYASDEGSSPTELAFKPPFPPGDSLPSSRAGTPTAANRPTRKQKTGSGLRVKTSPMKKKTGTSAGIPKDMRSPISNGGPMAQDGDNDDFCSACGGNGDLVCCDGCTRSFHFKCVDPPLVEGSQSLPDDWYCNLCQLKPSGAFDDDTGGVWGPLISELEVKNPRSFRLPEPIREYFVDVKTGADGEYEEIIPPKPKNNKAGWEEAPDYFRRKDAKGKIILCHRCNGEASAPNRMIIPCSFCGLYWHLDCVDVPLAKEPGVGRQWRCPAHVDDLLAVLPVTLAPAHRFRKIKGASVIKPAATRGFQNNGHIEIENDPSEDEEEQGFYELREFGHVYKLPEMSIKLDFISRVKQNRGKYLPSLYSSKPVRPQPVPKAVQPASSVPSVPGSDKPWNQRTMEEQQAALNLASLLVNTNDPAMEDKTGLLINALLSEAPPAVISLVAQSSTEKINAAKLSKKEKKGIQAFFNFLKEKLDNAEDSSDEEDEAAPVTPPETVDESAVVPEVTRAVDNSKFATVESVEDEDAEMIL
ncbi:hypothetical protein ONS96_008353 [Cadophora gregata f. sp. sojae]|nr:hypothetical protein ONS96_008353 [Cadophora gregata f. sp. sojae]